MLAEDTPAIQLIVTRQLNALNCVTCACDNGQIVLDQLRVCWHPFILMDYHMPVMDGLECTRAIRLMEREHQFPGRPPIYIVSMTADATAGTEAACMEAGMDRFMRKPITRAQLAVLVEEVKSLNRTGLAKKASSTPMSMTRTMSSASAASGGIPRVSSWDS